MNANEKKALLARFYEMWSGDSKIDPAEICSQDYLDHMPHPGPEKLEGLKAAIAMFRAAFPDSRNACQFAITEGDLVSGHAKFRGTHTGYLMDIPPSGKKVEMNTMDVVRIDSDGKICEIWHIEDMFAMMTQIGALPSGGH